MKEILFSNHLCPGDVCMIGHAVRSLHDTYPGQYQTGYAGSASELFQDDPNVVEVSKAAQEIALRYPLINRCNEYPVHFFHAFISYIQTTLKVAIAPAKMQGFLCLSEEERNWKSAVEERIGADKRFWVINAGSKSDYTAKQWDYERYQAIVHSQPDEVFVQIGSADNGHKHPRLTGSNLIDMVSQTDIRALMRLIYHSFGVITPVSFPMHLAYGLPAHPRYGRKSRALIVIAGGREPVTWQMPPNGQFLHTCGMLDCCQSGGCWRSRTAPLGDGDAKDTDLCQHPVTLGSGQIIPRCLDMIGAEVVIQLIRDYVQNGESELAIPFPATNTPMPPPPGPVTREVMEYLAQTTPHGEPLIKMPRVNAQVDAAKVRPIGSTPQPKSIADLRHSKQIPSSRRSNEEIWRTSRQAILDHESDDGGAWDGLKKLLRVHEEAIERKGEDAGHCWVEKQWERVNNAYIKQLKKERQAA